MFIIYQTSITYILFILYILYILYISSIYILFIHIYIHLHEHLLRTSPSRTAAQESAARRDECTAQRHAMFRNRMPKGIRKGGRTGVRKGGHKARIRNIYNSKICLLYIKLP